MANSLSGVQLAAKRVVPYVRDALWYKAMSLSLKSEGWVIEVKVDRMCVNKARGIVPELMEGYPVLVVPA